MNCWLHRGAIDVHADGGDYEFGCSEDVLCVACGELVAIVFDFLKKLADAARHLDTWLESWAPWADLTARERQATEATVDQASLPGYSQASSARKSRAVAPPFPPPVTSYQLFNNWRVERERREVVVVGRRAVRA